MIATIIPYFLLASISDNSTWPTGPEIRFASTVEINIKGLNRTIGKNSFEMFNELTCRPKTESTIDCKFQHKNLTSKMVNKETGEIKSEEMIHSDHEVYEPFYFQVGFDKKGVKEITMNEKLAKHEAPVDIVKAIANGLNVGLDLSEVQLDNDTAILKEMNNRILENCKGEIVVAIHSDEDSSEEDLSGGKYSLDLAPALKKLDGKSTVLLKNWNTMDCKGAKFFWAGMFMDGVLQLQSDANLTVNMANVYDMMTVSPGIFISVSGISVEVSSNDKKIELQEVGTIHLSDILPAAETWPAVENPLTMTFN